MRFGLKDISELPSMEEFEKMAGELAESDALEASAIEDRAGVPPEVESPSGAGQEEEATQKSSSLPEQSEAEGPAASPGAEELETVREAVSESRES